MVWAFLLHEWNHGMSPLSLHECEVSIPGLGEEQRTHVGCVKLELRAYQLCTGCPRGWIGYSVLGCWLEQG